MKCQCGCGEEAVYLCTFQTAADLSLVEDEPACAHATEYLQAMCRELNLPFSVKNAEEK
jgi:hypothetical protein